jgi:hypothetical protein
MSKVRSTIMRGGDAGIWGLSRKWGIPGGEFFEGRRSEASLPGPRFDEEREKSAPHFWFRSSMRESFGEFFLRREAEILSRFLRADRAKVKSSDWRRFRREIVPPFQGLVL